MQLDYFIAFFCKKTMEKQEDRIAEMVKERLSAWKNSQEGQTNGYEYERSFAEMMQQIESEIFKEMTGTEVKGKNKKKQF